MNQDNKGWLFLIMAISIFPISTGMIILDSHIPGVLLFLAGVPICLIVGINYERPFKPEVEHG